MTFPRTVRSVRQGTSCKVESLQSVVLNEGLEVLGTNEYLPDGKRYPGVFEKSGLHSVRLPSTLKRIEYRTFIKCKKLKSVRFPEGLEFIGRGCFSETGVESVEFPASLRVIS